MTAPFRTLTRLAAAALVASSCVALGACSSEKEASSVTITSHAPLEKVDVHYFRYADEQAVWRVSKTVYCLVANPDQMKAFGGFDKVQVVAPKTDFKRGRTSVEGLYCPNP